MTQRLNYAQQSPELLKKMSDLSMAVKGGAIEQTLHDLVQIRASQINGCAFCLDMHVKEAKIHGESELRLHHVAIWHESNLFAPRERAALAAPSLPRLAPGADFLDAGERRLCSLRLACARGKRVSRRRHVRADTDLGRELPDQRRRRESRSADEYLRRADHLHR